MWTFPQLSRPAALWWEICTGRAASRPIRRLSRTDSTTMAAAPVPSTSRPFSITISKTMDHSHEECGNPAPSEMGLGDATRLGATVANHSLFSLTHPAGQPGVQEVAQAVPHHVDGEHRSR